MRCSCWFFHQIITSSLNFWMIETGTVTFMNQTPASPVPKPKNAQAHQNAPIHTPENERLGRNCSPKNSFFGFGSECIWKCFSGWHPVLFLFITLNSPKLHVLCSLETDSKGKKQETPGPQRRLAYTVSEVCIILIQEKHLPSNPKYLQNLQKSMPVDFISEIYLSFEPYRNTRNTTYPTWLVATNEGVLSVWSTQRCNRNLNLDTEPI